MFEARKIGMKPVQNTKPRILIDVEDQNVKLFFQNVSLSHRVLLKDSRQLFLSCFHVLALTLLARQLAVGHGKSAGVRSKTACGPFHFFPAKAT